MQHNHEESKPALFYFLMLFLACGVSFIGYKFGGITGACIGFFFSSAVNVYALQIKHD